MELLVATSNKGKLREYGLLLANVDVTLLSLSDVGLDHLDVEETGSTFQDNAKIKARAYAQASGKFALADDSGLCVDALNGAPGVYSARYGDGGLDDAGRRQKLLRDLAHVPDAQRTAQFECVIAVANPHTGECLTAHGICRGSIRWADSDGEEGFGYDAIFQPEGYDQTFAQLPKEIKNRISHRGDAARRLVPLLQQLVREQNGSS